MDHQLSTNTGASPYVNVVANTRLQILSYIDNLDQMLVKALTHGLDLTQDGKFYKLTAADSRQLLFASTRARGGVEVCVRNMLLESVINTDKVSGFASFISMLATVKILKNKLRTGVVQSRQPVDLDHDLHYISQASRHASLDIAINTIKEYCKDSLASSMLLQACVLTGHSGQIYVDSTPAASNSIELTNGYSFTFGLEPNFCASSRTEEWKEHNPYVIIIDGIIETVGEINRVLEHCHNEKNSCIIFARGFSEEVLGTLAVNKARETLNVVPVHVPFDLEGINSLVDLAVICDSDIVSSIKGDAISAIDPGTLKQVDYINARTGTVVITNSSTEYQVKQHANNISKRSEESKIQDKANLLNKRLKSLSSVCTNIRIAGEGISEENLKLKIQHGINMLKHICRFGCINLKAIQETSNMWSKELIQDLQAGGINNVSAKELILGLKYAESISNNILSSMVYLTVDGELKDG